MGHVGFGDVKLRWMRPEELFPGLYGELCEVLGM